jgi:BolA protein
MNASIYQQRIARKLTDALAPIFLEIIDDSAHHAGHAGHDPKGETHFTVEIVSAAFAKLGQVERHRLVYSALSQEMQERVHALSLKTLSPDEYHSAQKEYNHR